jgi:ABC-type branched-subunit amino acid transport system permease subunit
VYAGIGTVATAVIVWILYFHYASAFGFTDRQKFFSYLAAIFILAIVFFFGARAVRSREGVDVALAYAEIPPE